MTENRVKTSVRFFLVIFALYGLYFVYIYKKQMEEISGKVYKNFSSVSHKDIDDSSVSHKDIDNSSVSHKDIHDSSVNHKNIDDSLNHKDMKYVLQWTPKSTAPFDFMGSGNYAFVKNNCKFTNCFVTENATLISLTEFDAIAFNGKSVTSMQSIHFPSRRSPKQKYIFGAMESSDNYPVCDGILDNYFNWTWTYKLDSDFRWGYITIYDTEGNVVGPAVDMKWPEKMDPISEDLKTRLSSKSKAAAWFVSHCKTKSKREIFVAELNKELQDLGWKVDIYGSCGGFSCSRSHSKSCFKMVENDYYFYMSLENSFSEDYVTEKLLTALNNYAVPVVFGAANYSRFLPDGSYLDGRELGVKNLARVMNEVIGNKTMYHDFFRWRNHFTYKETSNNVDICKLCEVLNDDQMVNTVSVWRNFRQWWNGATYESNCRKSLRRY